MSAAFEWREAPDAQFAVIGDPVEHSLSPAMHNAAFAELGLDHRYVAIRVPSGEVARAIEHLKDGGYHGVNVTVPHKKEALAACGQVEAFAVATQAVNTIDLRSGRGINTDAPGFLEVLREHKILEGNVLLLGAGGTARALALALVEAGFKLSIHNRTRQRALDLKAELGISAKVLIDPDPTHADLVLNTTSASLSGQSIDIDWQSAPPWAWAFDVMYAREPTPFLAAAGARGLKTLDGLPMLVAQGARSLEFWLGVEAPRDAMREAIR